MADVELPMAIMEAPRQRQRDRLSPRRRFATKDQLETGRVEDVPSRRTEIKLSPAPKTRPRIGLTKTKHVQEILRKGVNANAREQQDTGVVKKEDIAPDGGSAGREGRQFIVANVGNNGRIYLRPTVRPANQRYPQPAFVFPMTPPNTAGLDVLVSKDELDPGRGSPWTPTRSPSTPVKAIQDQYFKASGVTDWPSPHRRARSQSTLDEHPLPVRDSDVGAFRVVIDRPGTASKVPEFAPGPLGLPSLHVHIPSYKLGTPRFSLHGTAFLRNSSCTTIDGLRSSAATSVTPSEQSRARSQRLHSRRYSDGLTRDQPQPTSPLSATCAMSRRPAPPSLTIAPEMFDAMMLKPGSDHPCVVRYSRNGDIKAATPARLVAEITSDTFVNYDLLSDFFLTFRSFLAPADLLDMLVARLRWAISRDDDVGTVVRVRTFVALRHWILNYFADDFVVDFDLRRRFCELINAFVEKLLTDEAAAKVPLRILDELKQCWRRVCLLYWDGPDFQPDLEVDAPIVSGGVAGSRNPKLDPGFWEQGPRGSVQSDGIMESRAGKREVLMQEDCGYFTDTVKAGGVDSAGTNDAHRPGHHDHGPPLSPTSVMSEDFISCSFPSKMKDLGGAHQLGAHPVPASSVYENSGPIATTPKTLTGKRIHPNHAHKRSGSFSDSCRDYRGQQTSVQKVVRKNTDITMALPFAGSLVRGNLFPPGHPYVDVVAPCTPAEVTRSQLSSPLPHHKCPSAMSGPGMKRLLGSVRRALSTKSGAYLNASPTQGSFPHMPPLGVRGATINRVPGTAIVPQQRPRNAAPLRIDLLGAEIAEDFKKAVREDAEASAGNRHESDQRSSGSTYRGPPVDYSIMQPKATVESQASIPRLPASDMTNGSKSILIVDDTLPTDIPRTSGIRPSMHSDDIIAEAYLRPSIGPTPPTTPPEISHRSLRTSSPVLGQSSPASLNRKTSSIVDPSPSECDMFPLDHSVSHPSIRPLRRLSKPTRSVSLRRYASFHSGIMRYKSEHSFDATTCSELDVPDRHLSDVSDNSGVASPSPLRVLRRRPGGDLRAATNVGDLDSRPLRRAMSTGSMTAYTDSLRSSHPLSVEQHGHIEGNENGCFRSRHNFSLGALAEAPAQARVSMISATSSKPAARPSFEKGASMLAHLPDDDDDGGIESALLKLEGKFEHRRSDGSGASVPPDMPMETGNFSANPLDISTLSFGEDEEEKRKHRHEHIVDTPPGVSMYRPESETRFENLKPTVYQPADVGNTDSILSNPTSFDSYDPRPLLDRVSLAQKKSRAASGDWSQDSFLLEPSKVKEMRAPTNHPSPASSFEFLTHDSLRQPAAPRDSTTHSFLDSDSDGGNCSDLSTEMSIEVTTMPTDYDNHISVSTHHVRNIDVDAPLSQDLRHPPSPPMTLIQALSLSPHSPDSSHSPKHHRIQLSSGRAPASPEVTPPATLVERAPTRRASIPPPDPLKAQSLVEPSRETSVHLPFILAFDSQILAQQFTLIEKDALNELDWKDLLEMRWKDSNVDPRSWVDFLRSSEPRGVEVIIARFNIMVKWAVSEILLTDNIEERSLCISKYIHIASHCRKYRNFATMTQLTVALTSKEISRLATTWAGVAPSDRRALHEMEALVTPMSNFYNLRAEMEGSGAGQGCIPFVGIYTHDLLINFERPSRIPNAHTSEPLINFEKYRSTSAIVKNLLRLVEASQLYRFLPVEGVTERCLWMAALSDKEIERHGKLIAARS